MKKVKASNYLSYSTLTQLGHTFQEIQTPYIHISVTDWQHITFEQLHVALTLDHVHTTLTSRQTYAILLLK